MKSKGNNIHIAHEILVLALVLFLSLFQHPTATADSLFTRRAESQGSLFTDEKTKFEVGDIVTVLISENTNALTSSNLDTSKESTLEATAASDFLTGSKKNNTGMNILQPGELPDWTLEGKNEHNSEGTTRRSNKLTSTVSTQVTAVYPNGTVRIEGAKEIVVNREKSTMILTGTIRGRDITAQNTVLSSQIANAQIHYQGMGPLWNNERRGFFSKVLDWAWPF